METSLVSFCEGEQGEEAAPEGTEGLGGHLKAGRAWRTSWNQREPSSEHGALASWCTAGQGGGAAEDKWVRSREGPGPCWGRAPDSSLCGGREVPVLREDRTSERWLVFSLQPKAS